MCCNCGLYYCSCNKDAIVDAEEFCICGNEIFDGSEYCSSCLSPQWCEYCNDWMHPEHTLMKICPSCTVTFSPGATRCGYCNVNTITIADFHYIYGSY